MSKPLSTESTRIAMLCLPIAVAAAFGISIHAAEPSFEVDFPSVSEPTTARSGKSMQVLPDPTPQEEANPVTAARIHVTGIALLDNTILKQAEIDRVAAPYLKQFVSAENLQTLRAQLTRLYISKGYLNSGVVLPEQRVRDGVVQFRAVEGNLTLVEVSKNRSKLTGFAEREVRREVSGPLSLGAIETSIRKLELDPLVRRVSGQLLPGAKPGESRLRLDIEENHPFQVSVLFDNFESPTVGANRGTIRLQHMDLTGRRDTLAASIAATEGLRDAFVSYQVPFAHERLALSAYYGMGSSEVIESPFDELDIEGDNEVGGVDLNYRLVNRLNRQISLSTGLQYSSSETELLDESFSFSRGARFGRSTSTSAMLGAQWVERWGNQLLALRSSVRFGLDALNSSIIPSDFPDRDPFSNVRIPESKFTLFLTQLQWAKRLTYADSEIVVNAAWQQSLDPLLSVDKFAIGGNATVRGFRENSLLRDNGFYANLEWRLQILRAGPWSRLNLIATPFFDYAQASDRGSPLPTSASSTLSSVGLTLTARPTKRWFMQLTYGERLRSESIVAGRNRGLQDDGIHFALSYQWSPNL